ncbi:ferric-dicitrate binding protein FerR (iron transport regulator) [Flavobacterium nitrogenifigens]|uniref:Ferric-dicitrate binding protein FerR (Iron transport regulator) n=2 Tax=Flavobacterium TaxID=237 RepID=A0A7W7N9F8_9FLAO|nr:MULTISPECIES: FecR family protein [Flavobacterium]MBB4803446.1 ferric-dicitrate binding protein FerR (iron transport regulator) [Flavobacterium nitrogenifigens]MBB6388749.1 ferric-dicitrate binding protein FerR (iron transport regulator) [Flavobacterium notoginsengisoli]
MDKKKFDEEFEKLWNENPASHSEDEKEASWEQFHEATFAKKKRKSRPWRYIAAASVLLFILIGTGIYFNGNALSENNIVAETIIENTSSTIKFVVLPDSSKVELSPNSKISYGANFALNRKIEIDGEAYFKVKKDKQHPFQVFCDETTTTVLGTSFIVKESENEEITVELFEGSVQMNVKGQDQKWILKPGDKFTYGNQKASLTEFNRFIDFDNQKLSVVSQYIEENYGYKVILPNENLNQKITIRINKKEDLKTIVQLISEMYNLNFEINEDLKQITFQ